MQRMMVAAVLLAYLAYLACAGAAQAQRTQTRAPTGLMLNAHSVAAFGTTIRPSNGPGEPIVTGLGGGGGVQIGYSLTPRLMAFGGVDVAKQGNRSFGLDGTMALSHMEAGLRLNFPLENSPIQPYALASVARRRLSTTLVEELSGREAKLAFSGWSVGVGGGAQYFISPGMAIDGGVSLGFGKFGSLSLDGQRREPETRNSTTARLVAGLSWYPTY